MVRVTTRLCTEPGCREILVDAVAGSRGAAHRRFGWSQWHETENGRARIGAYGARWRRLRKEWLQAHPVCEDCGCPPATEVHHVGHEVPGDPGFYDYERLRALCNTYRKRSQRERVRGD